MTRIIKRDGRVENFDITKIDVAIRKAFDAAGEDCTVDILSDIKDDLYLEGDVKIEELQDQIEEALHNHGFFQVMKKYIIYREDRRHGREEVDANINFIKKYKEASNTANATIDDNSNVGNKNIGVLNSEIHKQQNVRTSRGMITAKLKELFPGFESKQYIADLENHIIYKHDESSFCGPTAPYCVSETMYPFLAGGIKGIGGLSASPKNLDSFCGMYINLIFATSAMFAGAVATSEFLVYFDYFARKEWGNNYYTMPEQHITSEYFTKKKTIRSQIHQYFQQVIYSINQPAAARGLQSAFVNFSYFDKPFFEGMFGDFYFPDGTQPTWDSVKWIQKEFMQWFNKERLRCIITFPVESFALVYKDGKFVDEESARFVAEEYARGHSFFTYISDTVDSLSSCCRLKNKLQTKEFNFTNGNMGVQTGSKSVITLNLARIVQDWAENSGLAYGRPVKFDVSIKWYLNQILDRVYKYHIAYNECLWDMYDAGLLPVYSAGFIDLNRQYLTIGLNGLNQAAEFFGIECRDNKEYQDFCQMIFSIIKEANLAHNGKYNGHTLTFNTECVPAESLAAKNYNWDKQDGYWVPTDTNLYASYIFKPNDDISIFEKLRLHGRDYAGDYLDGGVAAHINLKEHLSAKQYWHIINYAAQVGCQYFTFNIPNCECEDCGFIAKQPFDKCPKCGSTHIALWDRIIGYLTKIKNWADPRKIEQKTRIYGTCDIKEEEGDSRP